MGRFSDAGDRDASDALMRPASEKRQGTKSQSGTRAEVAYREVTRVEILCQPGVSRSICDPRATDLIFGSHSQLRASAEVYACADPAQLFVRSLMPAISGRSNAGRKSASRLIQK